MRVSTNKLYKLKEGAMPVCGTDFLQIIEFDSDNNTVLVYPEGFSEKGQFWADIDDLEEM